MRIELPAAWCLACGCPAFLPRKPQDWRCPNCRCALVRLEVVAK